MAAVAALLLAATGGWQPAQAQRAPQGSYLGSCVNVVVRGDNVVATCRKQDGGEQRSEICGFPRCTGDIGNDNGVLHCNFAGGPVWGVVAGRGGPPAPAYVAPAPAYAPGPAYARRRLTARRRPAGSRPAGSAAITCISAPRNCAIAARTPMTRKSASGSGTGWARRGQSSSAAAECWRPRRHTGAAFLLTCGRFRGTDPGQSPCAPICRAVPGGNHAVTEKAVASGAADQSPRPDDRVVLHRPGGAGAAPEQADRLYQL